MVWFTMLCLALDHLHEKKILHRSLPNEMAPITV